MHIKLSPIRLDESLEVLKTGDTLILNGEVFDFTQLGEGCVLPRAAINSKWFCGDVLRIDGELQISILLPHGPNAPYETRFPSQITINEDGEVQLPPYNEGVSYE